MKVFSWKSVLLIFLNILSTKSLEFSIFYINITIEFILIQIDACIVQSAMIA